MNTLAVSPPLPRRLFAEFLGSGLLVAIVVGSGIAASRLSTDPGLQLLENSIATALGLAVLIAVLGPVSGAHFNPVVSLVDALLERGRRRRHLDAVFYSVAQLVGGVGGALLANAMFDVGTSLASTERADISRVLAEVVATAGLIVVIFALLRSDRAAWVAPAVGAYIGAAYWFTSSTAFANPAVTIGRIFSDTFAGIAPMSALAFVGAQLLGGGIGLLLVAYLFPRTR